MISSLLELQVLNIFGSGICSSLEDCVGNVGYNEYGQKSGMSGREKSLLEELECLAAAGGLKGLGISVYSADAFRRLSMLSQSVSIWQLGLFFLEGNGIQHLEIPHNIWRSLQRLRLYRCSDVEVMEFVVDAERKSETCPIEQLQILYSKQLEEILWRGVSPSVFFHKLRDVSISYCHGLRSIGWVLELPSLVILELYDCKGVECLIDEEEQDRTAVAFPALKRLKLWVLPNLRHMCGPHKYCLPALERLQVIECPKLKKFPFPSNNNVSKLKEIRCAKRWWEGLEWDDEGIKASMESILTLI